MSVTPGLDARSVAMYSEILAPGSCPPSPGLAPWAILISTYMRRRADVCDPGTGDEAEGLINDGKRLGGRETETGEGRKGTEHYPQSLPLDVKNIDPECPFHITESASLMVPGGLSFTV